MSDPNARTFWDREVSDPTNTSWMEHPAIREYILKSISGTGEGLWPVDWFMRHLRGRRFERGLSIGCGTGALERDLIRKNLVQSIDAFDGSVNSLRLAAESARSEGLLPRIRYFAADFNEPFIPHRTYDIVFIHQALHHVAKLEKLLRRVLHSLKRGGILYLDEYIGPSRHEWNDALAAPQRRAFAAVPREMRNVDVLPLPIHMHDPSEAFRSGEIMEQLGIGFDVEAFRGYGGNILSVLYPSLEDVSNDVVNALLEEEKRVLAAGEPPYYAVIVARPKRGIRKTAASWRYFAEPKIKRVLRELKQRIRR